MFYYYGDSYEITIENCSFISIMASSCYGGVFYFAMYPSFLTVINNCTFDNITAYDGGVVYLECCDEYLNISYSLFQKCFAQNRV
jgi:hypothetical protein